MTRGVWVVHPQTGELIPRHLYHRPIAARSDLACPMIISDTMDGMLNPANGRRYTSKSAYYRAVRDSGSHIVERGEKPGARAELPDPIHDIKQAIEIVESRTPTKRARKRRKEP